MTCPECKKEVEQTEGKRPKVFCNSSCRSNFWQKAKRREGGAVVKNKTQGGSKIQNLNNPTKTNEMPEKQPKTNYTINTTDRPRRRDGEDAIDFAGRLNEWKKLNQ